MSSGASHVRRQLFQRCYQKGLQPCCRLFFQKNLLLSYFVAVKTGHPHMLPYSRGAWQYSTMTADCGGEGSRTLVQTTFQKAITDNSEPLRYAHPPHFQVREDKIPIYLNPISIIKYPYLPKAIPLRTWKATTTI